MTSTRYPKPHVISDAAFVPVTQSEIAYAQQLVGSASEDSLTLFDRGFMSAELFASWQGCGQNTHWLTPIKSKLRYEIIESPLLRSLKSDGIYQELWGILTSYNIVRLEMAAMAAEHK